MDIRRIRLLFAKIEDIVDREISLMDSTGYIIESTNFQKVGEYDTSLDYAGIKDNIVSLEDRLYYLINTNYGKNFTLSDTFNGLMAIPNLIGLLALSPIIFAMTKDYESQAKDKLNS